MYFKNVFLAIEARGKYLDPQEAIEWMAKKVGTKEAKEFHYKSKNYVISEDGHSVWRSSSSDSCGRFLRVGPHCDCVQVKRCVVKTKSFQDVSVYMFWLI